MRLFLDSSALAKRYVRDAGTDRLAALCAEADQVIVSILALPELMSTLNRLRRAGRLSESDYATIKQDVLDDLEEATTIELTPGAVRQAVACLERARLRSSDALHLASAMEASPDLFVTADRRQRGAAISAGLKVEPLGLRERALPRTHDRAADAQDEVAAS
ncbi:MAG TPA: type II toxin-antitoxin system VapC family toxin [Planctomycetota bacterium]|nr:type II toxin-antitoxin system VapC family toxin [Planctomycetota bacterium]HRR81299.1 type II toxin-antitoxin system VapC family toxin [Planctomycetota bacterium]HRT95193.1 type II toxin-antitoxin system VapC family toxin [Planctomycetota bacterium]